MEHWRVGCILGWVEDRCRESDRRQAILFDQGQFRQRNARSSGHDRVHRAKHQQLHCAGSRSKTKSHGDGQCWLLRLQRLLAGPGGQPGEPRWIHRERHPPIRGKLVGRDGLRTHECSPDQRGELHGDRHRGGGCQLQPGLLLAHGFHHCQRDIGAEWHHGHGDHAGTDPFRFHDHRHGQRCRRRECGRHVVLPESQQHSFRGNRKSQRGFPAER